MFSSSKELPRSAEGFTQINHISINSRCIYKATNSGIILITTTIILITTPVLLEGHYPDVVVGLVCSEKDERYARGSTILNRSHQESDGVSLSHKKIWRDADFRKFSLNIWVCYEP